MELLIIAISPPPGVARQGFQKDYWNYEGIVELEIVTLSQAEAVLSLSGSFGYL
jgi:hypothetical protein